MYKDTEDSQYKVLLFQRSEDVAVRPGFYQFVPSGGFEVCEKGTKNSNILMRENYNVLFAIYKELLEELVIGKKNHFEYGKNGETIRNILECQTIQNIEDMVHRGDAQFEFLGSCVDLVGLRNELSFVLKIDDPKFAETTFRNNEEGKEIKRYPIHQIESMMNDTRYNWNPSSLALWALFMSNHLWKDVCNA